MMESIPPLIIIAFIIVATIAYCLLVTRIVSCEVSDHQNAPTDDTTGQRSGLSP